MTLHDLSFAEDDNRFQDRRETESHERFGEYLAEARAILARAVPSVEDVRELPASAQTLRWFLLPEDLAALT